MEKEQSVTRTLRMNVSLDKTIQDIAFVENKTVSNIMKRFLTDSVKNYLKEHPNTYKIIEAFSKVKEHFNNEPNVSFDDFNREFNNFHDDDIPF